MQTNSNGQWLTVNDALMKLGISRATLYNRINNQELTSKKDGNSRLVYVEHTTKQSNGHPTKHTTNTIKQLEQQLNYFKDKLESTEQQLQDQRIRSDAIIMRLTEQNQLLLTSPPKKSWWNIFWNKQS